MLAVQTNFMASLQNDINEEKEAEKLRKMESMNSIFDENQDINERSDSTSSEEDPNIS